MIRAALLALALLAVPAWAAEAIDAPELYPTTRAREFLGQSAHILGAVTKVRRSPERCDVVLEFDGPRKGRGDPPLVALVRGEGPLVVTEQPPRTRARTWLRKLIGKRVLVEGGVETDKGELRIVATERGQLIYLRY